MPSDTTPFSPPPDTLENLRQLADTMPQIVWITRADGYHEYYNRHWWEYTGLTYEQARGEGWNLLLHPDDRQRSIDRWNHALRTGEPYEIEYRFRRAADGMYRWFLGRALPQRDGEGKVVKWFGTCTDIHDQKLAEEKIELASRQKDQFLAILSHELRTPLNAILGWAQLVQGDLLDPGEFREAIDAIERNAKAQARLIEDVLDVSRIINQKLHIERRVIALEPSITAALDTLRPAAKAKAITIEYRNDSTDLLVFADPARLEQVFGNLLSNAVKFTPAGGRIVLTVDRDASLARICVSDTGTGIPASFLPEIFELFRQADSTSTRHHGGLGLGLAIVRHLLDAQDGSIQAESEGKGRGATFTVRMPVVAVDMRGADRLGDGQPESLPARGLLAGVKVLVADDEGSARELIGTVLEKFGAQVRVAESADRALAEFEREPPDVLVSDIAMPGRDGYSLIAEIRARPGELAGRTPALALTAFASSQDRRRALQEGFDAHIAKPVEPIALVRAVASLRR